MYGTILLLIVISLVSCGVRFVQMFAPVSLACVILTVLALFAGGVHKMIVPDAGTKFALLRHILMRA